MKDTASWLMLVMVVLAIIVLTANYEELRKLSGQIHQIQQAIE
jgi:hypothetical protein